MVNNLKLVLLVLLVLSALISDIKTYRIPNISIILFVISGLTINLMYFGIKGLGDSIAGIVLPTLLLFILFAARMLGAGDIKLFCSIGAIMGWRYAVYCMAFSFMAGGVIALIIMLTGNNLIKRIKYFTSYMKCCFLTASVLPYSDFASKKDGTKMRFSYAVVVGTFAYQLFTVL